MHRGRVKFMLNPCARIYSNIFSDMWRICHAQVGFIQGVQGWFNVWKAISVIHHIKNKGEEKYTVMSSDAIKASDKIKIQFMKKRSQKPGIEGKIVILIKGIYKNSITDIILNGEILIFVPLKLGTRKWCLTSSRLFDVILETIASVKLSKRKREHTGYRERSRIVFISM